MMLRFVAHCFFHCDTLIYFIDKNALKVTEERRKIIINLEGFYIGFAQKHWYVRNCF
jgi:hypothetical protein